MTLDYAISVARAGWREEFTQSAQSKEHRGRGELAVRFRPQKRELGSRTPKGPLVRA